MLLGLALTCMSKIDGVGTLSVASHLSFCFLQSTYTFVVWQTFGPTGCLTIGFCREVNRSSSMCYWSPIVWFFNFNLEMCICTTASTASTAILKATFLFSAVNNFTSWIICMTSSNLIGSYFRKFQ